MDTNSNIRRGLRSTRVPLLRADVPTISDEQRRKNLYQSCVDEVQQEDAAVEHKRLKPVRELQAKLDINLSQAKRDARYDLLMDDYKFLNEICPAFYPINGDLGDAIRAAFLDLQAILTEKGVTITDKGMRALCDLSERNRGIAWHSTSPLTFAKVWQHLLEVDFFKEGREYTSTRPQVERKAKATPLDLREVAEKEYLEESRSLMSLWEKSLKATWGLVLSDLQRTEAVVTLERLNLSPMERSSWDAVRLSLVRRQVIPDCRTADEKLNDFIEQLPDISSSAGKRAIAAERNRLKYQSL